MKLLVLALCVCAASAATYQRPTSTFNAKPWQSKPLYQPSVNVQATASSQLGFYKASPTFAPAPAPTTARYYEAKPTFATALPEPAEPLRLFSTPTYAPTYAPALLEPVKAFNSYEKDAEATILSQKSKIDENGFEYNYETKNGIKNNVVGYLKNIGDTKFLTFEGQYEYLGLNGEPVVVYYTSDQDGYHPRSDALPTSPPMPEYVVRLLKYLELNAPPQASEKKY